MDHSWHNTQCILEDTFWVSLVASHHWDFHRFLSPLSSGSILYGSNTLICVAHIRSYWLMQTSYITKTHCTSHVHVGGVDSINEQGEKYGYDNAVVIVLYLMIVMCMIFFLCCSCWITMLCCCCYYCVVFIDCCVDAGVFRFFSLIHTHPCIKARIGNGPKCSFFLQGKHVRLYNLKRVVLNFYHVDTKMYPLIQLWPIFL